MSRRNGAIVAAISHLNAEANTMLQRQLKTASDTAMLDRVRDDLIGNQAVISTPFGTRPLVYADYTASGRAVGFLEDNIRQQVLPFYANTHSEASFTGAHTNHLREQARAQIRQSVNGTADDKVIFCGAGATAAINKLIDILGLRLPRALDERYAMCAQIPEQQRPVIFVGPYEHHSNELPWRETVADVVRIGLDIDGGIDQAELAAQLAHYACRDLLIGSFSAASNVTGIISDINAITTRLKEAGALAFWDFAAAGPYVAIDMNRENAAIDAAFISPHKFIGGPGTPGILVTKSALLKNAVPAVVGGGTVAYVSPTQHRYLADAEHREEGGTPAIVESIRAGAVFAIKDAIGVETITRIEHDYCQRAFEAFASCSAIEVLGVTDKPRLPIFSLRFHHRGRELHHGFVAALLNDLFGIQARGGCSCAGPYGHSLLSIDDDLSTAIDGIVGNGIEAFKPGWLRVNLHYCASEAEINYLLAAVLLVAKHGWRLLPSYRLAETGRWQHRDAETADFTPLAALLDEPNCEPVPAFTLNSLSEYLTTSAEILAKGPSDIHMSAALADAPFNKDAETHRWFTTAQEAAIAQS